MIDYTDFTKKELKLFLHFPIYNLYIRKTFFLLPNSYYNDLFDMDY